MSEETMVPQTEPELKLDAPEAPVLTLDSDAPVMVKVSCVFLGVGMPDLPQPPSRKRAKDAMTRAERGRAAIRMVIVRKIPIAVSIR